MFFVHKRSHNSIEEAVWVDRTLLGRQPYLKGQFDLQGQLDFDQTLLGRAIYLQERSDLQGQLDFASVVSVGHVLLGCSVSPAEQDGWATVVHQCSAQLQSMEQCCFDWFDIIIVAYHPFG